MYKYTGSDGKHNAAVEPIKRTPSTAMIVLSSKLHDSYQSIRLTEYNEKSKDTFLNSKQKPYLHK